MSAVKLRKRDLWIKIYEPSECQMEQDYAVIDKRFVNLTELDKLQRRCNMLEIELGRCSNIIQRWEVFTHQKAQRTSL